MLLVTFDTTRYDKLRANGDPEARTPTVDQLAAEGLRFERAFASVGLTLPSHTTMMTGLEPFAHGVHNNGRYHVAEKLETLAERLRAVGYATGAFVSAYVLDAFYGLNQGFDVYSDDTEPPRGRLNFTVPTRPGAEVVDDAIEWLDSLGEGRPYFLWAHFYDPHRPWTVEPGFENDGDAYAAEITYADAQLGRLLERVRQRDTASGDETLIVFTADHGEGLGEHEETTHGILAYDSTLHVPLILVGAGVPAGERSAAYVRHVDIVPTVLTALSLEVPDELPGRGLLEAARDPEAEVVGYFESLGPSLDHGWEPIEGVRTPRWKLTHSLTPIELFDTFRDARELADLSSEHPEIVQRLRSLDADERAGVEPASVAIDSASLDLEQLEQLAALGYIALGGEGTGGARADPRKVAQMFSWVDAARSEAGAGDYDRAIEALELFSSSPALRPLVLRSLAPVYVEAGRLEDAAKAYADYVELTGSPDAAFGLARTHYLLGHYDDVLELTADADARSTGAVGLRSKALAMLGRIDEARAFIDSTLHGAAMQAARRRLRAELVIHAGPFDDGAEELRSLHLEAPDDPQLLSWLGYYLAIWKADADRSEALELLRRAASDDAEDPTLQANLGWAAFRLGEVSDGVGALEAALAIDPGRVLDRVRLATARHEAGDDEGALLDARLALRQAPGADWAASARELIAELGAESGAGSDTDSGTESGTELGAGSGSGSGSGGRPPSAGETGR